jgi:integrase
MSPHSSLFPDVSSSRNAAVIDPALLLHDFLVIMRARMNQSRTTARPTTIHSRIRSPKTHKGSHIRPSALRPKVPADQRLTSWKTNHSQSFERRFLSLLPMRSFMRTSEVMKLSLDHSTRGVYGAGLLRFTQFCDSNDVPEDERMPASEILLSAFVAHHAGSVSSSAMNSWLAALRAWHTINGAPWHAGDMLLQSKKGLKKLVPGSSRRPKRPPITIEHMYALYRGLDLSNTFDAAVWAVASIAFWSCCRLGELVVPSPSSIDPLKHVMKHTTLRFASSTCRYATLHIPWSKTTKNDGTKISITSRDDPTCPLTALEHHLDCSSQLPSDVPFFSFETVRGGWAPMTRNWFLDRCNAIWERAGYERMSGHSFRIGGTTHLLLSGVPPDVVAVQGRWTSNAFLSYWRQVDSILPLFIDSSGSASRIESVRLAIDQYRKRFLGR